MYTIKNIPVEDIPQVLEIYTQGVEAGKSTFSNIIPTPEEWDNGHLKFARVGAYDGDLLVGWAALSPTSSRPWYRGVCEVSLYVREGFRDGGVGTAIMAEEVRQSEEGGVWTLYAHIFDTNKGSIKMCQKNGFRIIGTRERIARNKEGKWQDTVCMERRSTVVGVD